MSDRQRELMNESRAAELSHRFLEGALDDARAEQFSSVLASDPKAVSVHVQAAVLDELLVGQFERHCEEAVRKAFHAFLQLDDGPRLPSTISLKPREPASRWAGWLGRPWVKAGLAAAVALVATGTYLAAPKDVAMVTRLVDTRLANRPETHVGDRLKEGDRLEVTEGLVELTFDHGTVVAIKGPADFQIVSGMLATSRGGRITVEVGERAVGFTVETPSARIVDWGTKFGVGVEGEETDVVVFDGIVDLHARSSRGRLEPTRLTQGEALRVSRGGELHRIVSVSGSEFPTPHFVNIASTSAPIIAAVSDNVRDGATNKCYQIIQGGLREDAPAYVDRSHQWNGLSADGLPRFLVGADYVMPFNEDKRVEQLRVAVTFARDANVYVIFDGRVPTPEWLISRFEDTGIDIGLDEGPSLTLPDWTTGVGGGESIDTQFRVWKCVVSKGDHLVFGPQKHDQPPATVSGAMYAIAATAFDN